jgi:hypothetical protein
MYTFECVLNIGKLYPVREANSKEEFIGNLITEYNEQCFGLLDIRGEDITEISSNKDDDEPIQDSNEKEPIQDSKVKYYIADIEQRIGEYQPTSAIRFQTEGDPKEYLADIVKGFYGDAPNEDEPNSGVYWNETMEAVCYAGNFSEVNKETFEAVGWHVSDMTGYGFSEYGKKWNRPIRWGVI